MKELVVLVCLCCAVLPLTATAGDEQETLFSGDIEHGGYGGPVLKLTSIKSEPAVLMGGYGGWFINHMLMIGGGGFGLVNNMTAPAEAGLIDNQQPSIGFGYGGPMLEFTGNSNSLVHCTHADRRRRSWLLPPKQ